MDRRCSSDQPFRAGLAITISKTMSDDPKVDDREVSDGDSPVATPGVDGGETPFQDALNDYPRLKAILAYLPVGATEPTDGYTGILSYSVEWHAAMIGVAVGATAATTGEKQLALGLVSLALGLGRFNQAASEKVKAQLKTEPWYAIVGVAVGYVAVQYGPMVADGFAGVGV